MPLDLELPPVVILEQINWKIINEGNQEEVFAELKKANIDPVLFSLTDEDYELMQKNNVQLRNQIIKYRAIIEAYKLYYEPEEQIGTDKDTNKLLNSEFQPKTFNKDD
jgi:triosephosphate isomerase